jgi:hypothetical protein
MFTQATKGLWTTYESKKGLLCRGLAPGEILGSIMAGFVVEFANQLGLRDKKLQLF